MRKSYYVMHKFITLCEKVITLCGNYYIMRKLLRYAASQSVSSVVVDDVATFVDLEHGLEFTVDDYVHGMFQCGCKVHLDAEITLSCQMKTTTVATVGG